MSLSSGNKRDVVELVDLFFISSLASLMGEKRGLGLNILHKEVRKRGRNPFLMLEKEKRISLQHSPCQIESFHYKVCQPCNI
jgi:hypothetical protein